MMREYVEFTKQMKRDYTILAPNMLPIHFKLVSRIFKRSGYNLEILCNSGPSVMRQGLKYVHNDACYPAILVIGQFIDALESGKYDSDKTALLLFQTGGGCRASNYISLLRKALKKAGYGFVPVISLNFMGLEKHSGFRLTPLMMSELIYGLAYGDLIMSLVEQCRPYELNPGDSDALAERITDMLAKAMSRGNGMVARFNTYCRRILGEFSEIPLRHQSKPRVGVVGEIYVKFSPLGNNNLADFLLKEGAEMVTPGLLDFFLYCLHNNITDYRLYGKKRLIQPLVRFGYKFVTSMQDKLIHIMRESSFLPMTPFRHIVSTAEKFISPGVKMGEGWLLAAEVLDLYESGVKNIVCAQPFGCLPNHICGKGMIKPLKDAHPDLNMIAIDYDPGSSAVNQENRLRLMLSNARANPVSSNEAFEGELVLKHGISAAE